MDAREAIDGYIDGQAGAKRQDLRDLHQLALEISPATRLWFVDGRNAQGKVVANPSIGYGEQTLNATTAHARAFYRLGVSAHTSGLSIYVMGLADRTHLSRTYGPRLGKAKITGYCIRFRSLRDLDPSVLRALVAETLGPDRAAPDGRRRRASSSTRHQPGETP